MDIGEYYDDDVDVWRKVLGEGMHYHHAYYDDDNTTFEQAIVKPVHDILKCIDYDESVLDLGCGWGGPAAIMEGECADLDLMTNSRMQFEHCLLQGFTTIWADISIWELEKYDTIVSLESFEHFEDKLSILKKLRPMAKKFITIFGCSNTLTLNNFGGSCFFEPIDKIKEMFTEAGWTIKHYENRRRQSMKTYDVWRQRISDNYEAVKHVKQIRELEHLCEEATSNREKFIAEFPLAFIVAT